MEYRLGTKQPDDSVDTDNSETNRQGITSIIILTCNKFDYNKLCIESIRQYTEPNSYEIIVVDNHSTDGTVEWLQNQRDIKLILNKENVGFPAGCNQGIKVACGDSILLLNNDTIVTPNWLANLRRCLFSSPDIGAVGAVTNSCSNFQSIPCDYSSIEEMQRFAKQINNSNPGLWEDRTRLIGFCMLIKSEVIAKIGLLDEEFSPGNYEDDDYSLRIRNAGYRLMLCRDTFIHHFGSVSFGEQSAHHSSLLEINKGKFRKKWGVEPYSVAPYTLTRDMSLRKWFTYHHEYCYFKQLMDNTKMKFYTIIDQAEFALLSGNFERAAMLVKQAADYAHHSHPGFFVAPRLELILRNIARKLNSRITSPAMNVPHKNPDKKNILHVLSQGYDAGGHTRVLERWIRMDSEAVHSIMVTLNSKTNPQWLRDAAIDSGGWYHTLDTLALGLCQRAKVLRDWAANWADVVVLHIHPHDPVAPIAFGIDGNQPVIFLNHADRAFTIGMSAADIVAEQRSAGQKLTLDRRNAKNCVVLPIPLGRLQPLEDKQTVRKALGIDANRVVFLTNASGQQLIPCGEYNYLKLAKEIIARYPNSEILVVGPADAGEWSQLKQESNGRIRAFGFQRDLSQFFSAADVYLDSIPLGSPMIALEAGAQGVPVIGLATDLAMQLASDIVPGIMQTHFFSCEELFAEIDKLVSNEAYRINQGNTLKAVIHKDHCWGWSHHVNRLYSLLPATHHPAEILEVKEPSDGSGDVIWTYYQHRSGLSRASFG